MENERTVGLDAMPPWMLVLLVIAGLAIVNQVPAVILIGGIAFVAWLVVEACVALARNRAPQRTDLGVSMGLCVATYLLVTHLLMMYLMSPIWSRFCGVTDSSPESISSVEFQDGHNIVSWDVTGATSDVLEQRERVLAENGYTHIGVWETGSRGTRCYSLYIFAPPLAAEAAEYFRAHPEDGAY